MQLTDYHAKYIAHELTRRFPPDSVEKLTGALVDAQVDLNPHQIDAALFAFRSPLSKGAVLADEVGLGKTIEAGLVLSQKWAERKRRVLVITPANLRKQWYQELTEKFFLPCRILETKSYNAAVKVGQFRPFEAPDIVICSYQFARSKASDVAGTPWDLVVIDEAHRLRNVYKPSNIIANTLKLALAGKDKLLVTATPLQNSLLELFGLVRFVDEHAFGDLKSFREQFANVDQPQVFQALKARLRPVCHRTLRRQVLPYIKYTQRLPIVQPFTPEESEDRLYHLVSDYLRRENLQALPASQRSLMTLVLRKLLASSTFAIAGSLVALSNRLKAKLRAQEPAEPLEEALSQEYEALDATAEEWTEDEPVEPMSAADRLALEQEIADLDAFAALATSIEHNAKGKALLTALHIAFAKAADLGAAPKAIIFTESRRTQSYLLRVLADSPFADGIVLFNGSNTDERSRQIYADWLQRHEGTDRVTGSRTADLRSALVDYFREEGRIMIATEAGAEGINLQFCSLVVNYDLPWNPQRVEQRIGRCHRYGQQHDVVVVNFLNQNSPPSGVCWKNVEDVFLQLVADNRIWFGKDGSSMPRRKTFLSESEGNQSWTWWTNGEVGHTQEAKKESIALFGEDNVFDTPKPERLIQRVIAVASNPGDWVLDSFAGSGTTGAVAQKMGRRWIMVELGEHCHTHIIPRLKKVIDGEDPGGVTEAVGWKGGGGFRYYRLAPSLLERDKWGNWVINKEYNASMLAEAVCKLEGFQYAPSDTVYWQHGHSTERDFIYVTTAHLGHDQLQQLSEEVGPDRTLLVLCTAFRAKPDRYPNLTVKKIPKTVLSRCEWGHDDYSLRVENLPKAPPKKGQLKMFGEEVEQ